MILYGELASNYPPNCKVQCLLLNIKTLDLPIKLRSSVFMFRHLMGVYFFPLKLKLVKQQDSSWCEAIIQATFTSHTPSKGGIRKKQSKLKLFRLLKKLELDKSRDSCLIFEGCERRTPYVTYPYINFLLLAAVYNSQYK
jgi:hypothetical protein